MSSSPPSMDPSEMSTESLAPPLLVVAWVCAILATMIVTARIYVRVRKIGKLGTDDYLILATYAFAICNSAFVTVSVSYGLGRHIGTLQPSQIMNSVKYIYICEFFTILCPGFGRISYAFLLLQLLPPITWRRRFLWTIITVQFVIDVGTVIITYAQCQPINAFWNPEMADQCWTPIIQEYTGFFQGAFCSVVDLILALFPASLFWSLKMKLSAKISLSVLMGLGVFAMIASIAKTIQLRQISAKGDATYAMAVLAICFTLEAYLVLIAASIPTLRPLMGAQKGKVTNTSARERYSQSATNSSGGRRQTAKSMHSNNFPINHFNRLTNPSSENLYYGQYSSAGNDNEIPLGSIAKYTRLQVDFSNSHLNAADRSAHRYV